MKKILVLTLVMGIASLASAGLDLSTVTDVDYSVSGQTVTITTSRDVLGMLLHLETSDGTDISALTFASGWAINDEGYFSSGVHDSILGSKGSNDAFQGMIFSFDVGAGVTSVDFVAYDGDDATVTWGSDNSDAVLTGTTMTIPEPATMALLGLGSLFLARRKK